MEQNDLLEISNEILRKRSLSDEVYEFLYEKIIAGKYIAGDWLRQDDISTQLGVSQTPVREALDRLVASGLAERVPFRGVRVPQLAPNEIIDAFIMRLLLENLAARLAINVIQNEEIQTLAGIVDKTENLLSLEDMSTLRQLNKEFHSRIVENARSPLLSKLYEMTTNSFPDWMLYEYMFRHPELLQNSLKREYYEHKAIVEAFEQKDLLTATRVINDHIKNLGDELELYLGISGESIHKVEKLIEPMISSNQ